MSNKQEKDELEQLAAMVGGANATLLQQQQQQLPDQITTTNIADEVVINKKKPGRPKKNLINIPIDIRGILEKPHEDCNKVEMSYANPKMFKKIFSIFKAYECENIAIIFEKTGIRMHSLDHLQKTNIIAWIDGTNLNWYFCAEQIIQYHHRTNLENIFSTIDKTNHKIVIILHETSYKSKLKISLTETQFADSSSYTIEAIAADSRITIANNFSSDSMYKLRLVFDSKHFKKKINDISKFSQTLHMCKSGPKEKFKVFVSGNQSVNFVGTYEDDAKIHTMCNLGEREEIKLGVSIDNIKPFSNSCIGNEVILAADTRKQDDKTLSNLSLSAQLDPRENKYTCCIKIFTEVV